MKPLTSTIAALLVASGLLASSNALAGSSRAGIDRRATPDSCSGANTAFSTAGALQR